MPINTKHIYTVATLNGISHKEVRDYICWNWGLSSTKDLTEEEYRSLINYLENTGRRESNIMASTEKVFVKGMWGKAPRDGAPSFCVGSISIKSSDFVAFLNETTNEAGYVNIDITKNKKDETKFNCVLNTYKKADAEASKAPEDF